MRKVIGMKRILAIILLIAVGATAFGQSDSEWYIGKVIKDIRFEGLVVVTPKDLESIIKQYKNKNFTDELWTDLLAKVYEFDYFDSIEPEAVPADAASSAVIIQFKVKEKPAVIEVAIVGNDGLRTTQISDTLSVKTETIFVESRMRLDEIAIRRLYQSKGYPNVRVSSSSESLPSGVKVIFTIEEGIQNIVDKVIFEGVSSVSTSTLKGELKIKEKGLFQAGEFNESDLEASRQAIEAFYGKRGFVDARVIDVRRDSMPAEKGNSTRLTLTFVIVEGKSYLYGGMGFEGNTLYSSEELSLLLRQKTGGVLSTERLLQDQSRVADRYFENGYIFNGFKLADARDEDTGTITYTLRIEERPQAHIEDIIFTGNTKTKDFVLRRLVPLESGDVFSKTKVLEALRNLYNTQYFSSIVPEYEQGSQDLMVDLLINVEEQSTASIQFGLTYTPSASSGSFPIIGLVNWSDINFLGNGQKVALETNLAIASQDLTFSFGDDWLLGRRISGSVEFSFAHSALQAAQDSAGPIFEYGDPVAAPDPYNSYAEWEAAGFAVPTVNKMSYDTWTFSLGYSVGFRFETPLGTLGLMPGMVHELGMKTYDDDQYRPFDSTIAENLDRWLLSNSIYGRVYLNKLDLWYDPSNGYYASQRLALTGWFNGELNHFIRSDTRLDAFVKLVEFPITPAWSFKAVLGGHTKFSTLIAQPWRDEVEASDSKMLAIDGTFVGRGWSTLASTYGTALWDNWLELRIPLVPNVLALDGFLSAALLSSETGLLNVANTVNQDSEAAFDIGAGLSDMSLENFAFSAGYGLRFLILQFPFRIYFAKRFVYDGGFKPASDSWDFVLSVTTNLD